MQPLTAENIRSLASSHLPPCVSLYLPTHGGRLAEDRSKLEGLVRRARQLVRERVSRADLDALFAPLEPLLTSPTWAGELEGLAVFLSPGFHARYRLPVAVPELLVVADSFHIRPLLGYVEANQHFFVLLLSQGHVGFLEGNAEGLVAVVPAGLPRSLEEALGQEQREPSLTYHFGARGGRHPIYGGGGKADSSRDEDLARFCRAVDQALWSVLRDEKAPLILAAPEREAALFRSITRYAHVAHEILGADLGRSTIPEIHRRTWPVVQKLVAERESEVLERYDRSVSGARALDELRAIAKFAIGGRVRDLLLRRDANLWGRLDRETGDVALHGPRADEREEDVLDDIADAVILRGGEVWSLEEGRMPTRSPVAATLRW
jgi:hypothetical protein